MLVGGPLSGTYSGVDGSDKHIGLPSPRLNSHHIFQLLTSMIKLVVKSNELIYNYNASSYDFFIGSQSMCVRLFSVAFFRKFRYEIKLTRFS